MHTNAIPLEALLSTDAHIGKSGDLRAGTVLKSGDRVGRPNELSGIHL